MSGIREFFKGKKTYILAGVAVIVAVQDWAASGAGALELFNAVWLQLSVLFLRAGISSNGT